MSGGRRGTPALYVVEDVHWIDEVSDSMLADAFSVVLQTHDLVLVTYRPEYGGALTQMPGAQTLTLAPLVVRNRRHWSPSCLARILR